MKILYHSLSYIIDFLFPAEINDYSVSTFSKNNVNLGQNIFALFSYQDPNVKDAVWQIKYYKNERICNDIAQALYVKIETLNMPKPFLLLPIPMSDASKRQRGYNQTEFLAEKLLALFKNYECNGISNDLIKNNSHRAQHTLEKAERIENAKEMFLIRKENCFKDKNILILDDVVTTGSTLREAMRVINAHGAKSISAIAIAH